MALGKISNEYFVTCGRCEVRFILGEKKEKAKAISHGWINTKKDGWICPVCHALTRSIKTGKNFRQQTS